MYFVLRFIRPDRPLAFAERLASQPGPVRFFEAIFVAAGHGSEVGQMEIRSTMFRVTLRLLRS
jgi:hypothetical protein